MWLRARISPCPPCMSGTWTAGPAPRMFRTVRREPDAARALVRGSVAARPAARHAPCVPGNSIACAHARAWREKAVRALGVCAVHLTPHVCARAAFSRHGAVKDVKMKEGYCFVDFENQGDADDAISRMDGYVPRPAALTARTAAPRLLRPCGCRDSGRRQQRADPAADAGCAARARRSNSTGARDMLWSGARAAPCTWDPSFPCTLRRRREGGGSRGVRDVDWTRRQALPQRFSGR